jgi:hypothetical protein
VKRIWNNDTPVWVNLLVWFISIIVVLGLVFGFMCLNGWLIMLVWNATLPAIFGFTALTFWQAFGLDLLVWLLFGGIGKGIITLLKDD